VAHRAAQCQGKRDFYFWAKKKAASLQPKKPPLPEPIYAIGSMEYQAQQAAKEGK
jgi:hypothetical protein